MQINPRFRAALAEASLEFVPPLIRQTLLDELGFRQEYDLRAETFLSIGEVGITFGASEIFGAVQEILSGAITMKVNDATGEEWELKRTNQQGELLHLALFRDHQVLPLPDLAGLSSDMGARLNYIDRIASDLNFPKDTRDRWRNILRERPLEANEVHLFLSEIQDTPVEKAHSIRNQILRRKELTGALLIPTSRRYYERLVGTYDGSVSIRDYAAGRGKNFLRELSAWQPYEGFLFALLLSSHSSITTEIDVDRLSKDDIVRAFNFRNSGDRISQLGAIEVGLRIVPIYPEIETALIRLIEQVRDDDVNGKASGFRLLLALFVLVDGELSRMRLLATEPPFYRRLAALSQAALIHRQMLNSDFIIDTFSEAMLNDPVNGEHYIQSLADMRLEPRWNPDFGLAAQIKEFFFGRIMIAAKNNEQNIKNDKLLDLILGAKSESLRSISDPLRPYLPGPLEGAEESQIGLPAEFAKAIEVELSEEEIGPASLILLMNSALLFRVGLDQAELAARALKAANYRLAHIEDRSQLVIALTGLATVAAVTRSDSLADELRILVRRYKRDPQHMLAVADVVRICLIAAASRADLNKWREFVGDWLTELAFGDLEGDDGDILHSHLQYLCHVVPELWVSCGRADAALMAYTMSRHLA